MWIYNTIEFSRGECLGSDTPYPHVVHVGERTPGRVIGVENNYVTVMFVGFARPTAIPARFTRPLIGAEVWSQDRTYTGTVMGMISDQYVSVAWHKHIDADEIFSEPTNRISIVAGVKDYLTMQARFRSPAVEARLRAQEGV